MIQNAVEIASNAIEHCLNISANSTQARVYWVMCTLLHGDSSDVSESKHANRNGRRASTWLYSLCVKWMNSLLDHCFTVERCWHYYICSKYIYVRTNDMYGAYGTMCKYSKQRMSKSHWAVNGVGKTVWIVCYIAWWLWGKTSNMHTNTAKWARAEAGGQAGRMVLWSEQSEWVRDTQTHEIARRWNAK